MKHLILISLLFLIGCGKETEFISNEIERLNVNCEVYDLNTQNYTSLPDFDTITNLKVGNLFIDKFDFLRTNNSQSFQKFVNTRFEYLKEKFALRCFFRLKSEYSGNHTLTVRSDDGFKLSIDGVVVSQFLGLRSENSTSVTRNLNAEQFYNVKLEYYNNTGEKALYLLWTQPNGVSTIIDEKNLFKN